jgi:glycine cleavage system H protein
MLSRVFSRFATLYTKTHEWINVVGKIGTVGLTEYAAHHLGDIVFADVQVGRVAKSGDELGDLESVKATAPIICPLSGKVIEVNPVLADNPGIINSSPEKDGWIAKLELSDPGATSHLLDSAAYKKFLESAEH